MGYEVQLMRKAFCFTLVNVGGDKEKHSSSIRTLCLVLSSLYF